jgi:hypothetical protein
LKVYLLLGILLFSKNIHANMREPFQVRFETRVQNLETTQAQADLAMARDVRYCRGAMMPKPQGPWRCQSEQGTHRCERTFACARIHQEFNRLTETKKLVAKARANPNEAVPVFSISPPPPDLPESRVRPPDGMKMVEAPAMDEKPRVQETLQKAPELKRTPRPTPQATQRGRSNLVTGEVDLDEVKFDEEDQELMAMFEEAPPRADNPFSEDFLSGFSWANFMLSMNLVSNEFDGSLTTINAAWTPRYQFSFSSWSIRAHLGGHLFESSFGSGPERFLVIETLGFAQYRLSDYFLTEFGIGQQYWNVDAGSSYLTWSLGAAWSPVRPWLSFIDRLGVSYQSISNEDSSREFRASLGVSF